MLLIFAWFLFLLTSAQKIFSNIKEKPIAHYLFNEQNDLQKQSGKKLSFLPQPINCFVSGQIQEGFFHGKNLKTLLNDLPDTQTRLRHRMHLGFYCDQKETEDPQRPLLQAAIKLHNMQWWQDEYSNLLIKYYRITSKVPLFSFSDAWIKLYSTAINPEWKEFQHALKIGYFPYQLGRGVSLGFADEGGIKHLGFELSYDPIESAYYCPGILLQGHLHKNMRYELYGSLLNAQYEPLFLNTAISETTLFSNRVDTQELNEYGKHLNRWVMSEKIILEESHNTYSWRAEQYLSYLHSEYNFNDIQLALTDRGIYAGTYGFMFDFSWNQWSLNIEAAGQFGTLEFFGINTNTQRLQKDSNADLVFAYDNAGIRDYGNVTVKAQYPMPIADPLKQLVEEINLNESSREPFLLKNSEGKTVFNLGANQFEATADIEQRLQDLATQALPPTASAAAKQIRNDLSYNLVEAIINGPPYNLGTQLRPEKTLNLHGYFFMADVSYACKTIPITYNLTGGYLSGDQVPIMNNDNQITNQQNYEYKGFIPLKDNRYRGLGVKGFSFFTLRTIERPAGENVHFNDISNLAFFGFGADMIPFKPDKKIVMSNNLLFFFQPYTTSILDDNQNKTSNPARSFAAVELNSSLQYRFLPQAELLIRGAFFMPQQLYRDMKNQLMEFMTIDGINKQNKRGADLAYAIHIRISYDF